MVYEKQPDYNDEYVVSWDSPLSSAPKETRLNVQIVAIYTNDEDTVPDMAMVAVNKEKASSGTSVAPMMQNLFDESERQILRALDFGLDNVQQGKVQFTEKTNDSIPKNVRSMEEAIDAEIVAEEEVSRVIPSNDNDLVMDTAATTDSKKPDTADPNEDFAVAAAKKAAAKRNGKQVNRPQGGDYAVEAAKRAAQSRTVDSQKIKPAVAPKKSQTNQQSHKDSPFQHQNSEHNEWLKHRQRKRQHQWLQTMHWRVFLPPKRFLLDKRQRTTMTNQSMPSKRKLPTILDLSI